MDEKFFQGLDKALQHTMDKAPPQFGGKPGEAVPEVDPNDIKAVSQFYQEMAKDHPGEQFAIGIELLGQVCKPGADVTAVYYRASMIEMIAKLIATEQLAEINGTLDDKVYKAAATIPMEWMGVGIVRKALPFDVEEFLRLCAA